MDATDAFTLLRDELADHGVRTGAMMGRPMLGVGRRMLACLSEGRLALRLGRDSPEHAEALGLDGAEVFRPGGTERRFHDWVAVSRADEEEWLRLGVAALAFASAR